MSNNNNNNKRYDNRQQQTQTNYNERQKSHQIFVPKSQNPNDPNPSKFSSSLRQSLDAAATSSSGTRLPAPPPNGGCNFVNYLPQDEAVAAGFGADEGGLDSIESQRVVDHLNDNLSRLLKLKPRDFWKEVANDTSLHEFVDTYLKFRSRWYDFPYRRSKGIVAGVIVGEFELSRRVFMLLYRISCNRDPGALATDSLSPKDHAAILQDKGLLDLPKLLDICAVYGHENEDLTRLLVDNALKAQPWIYDNVPAVMPHFLSIIHTMHQRCSSSLEALFSRGHENNEAIQLHADLLEVMDFINDAVVSMDAFVCAYKQAAVFFSCPVEMSHGNEEVLSTLAQLHDSLIPSFLRGFSIIFNVGEDGRMSDITVSLKMLAMRLVNFGWKLLDICYLNDKVFEDNIPIPAVTKMFPAKVEDPGIRADILIQTFKEINGVMLQVQEKHNGNTFLQNIEKFYNVMSQLESLQSSGWMFMDNEQFQYLSGMMMSAQKANITGVPIVPSPVSSNKAHMDEDTAIIESKISQIKDLFPDYGKGFLSACLEVYNHNPEEVIQRILEGTLHDDLKCLDTSLETTPKPNSTVTVNRKDKGKGKLVETVTPLTQIDKGKGKLEESSTMALTNPMPANLQKSEEPTDSSLTAVGRFVRKSKWDSPTDYSINTRDKDLAKNSISQYEYEDEYDDSFDDLGLSVAESGVEDSEMLRDKVNSDVGRSWGTESEHPSQAASRWGSRKKPQFYVKDGRHYSYKVEGSVAAANYEEASLLTQAQGELIHGLGRGGNIAQGAVKKIMELEEGGDNPGYTGGRGRRGGRQRESNVGHDNRLDDSEVTGRGNKGYQRVQGQRGGRQREPNVEHSHGSDDSEVAGRGNKGYQRGQGQRGGRQRESNMEHDNGSDDSEVAGSGNMGNQRGRGRRGGRNNYRKDQAMKKHFSGLTGF